MFDFGGPGIIDGVMRAYGSAIWVEAPTVVRAVRRLPGPLDPDQSPQVIPLAESVLCEPGIPYHVEFVVSLGLAEWQPRVRYILESGGRTYDAPPADVIDVIFPVSR